MKLTRTDPKNIDLSPLTLQGKKSTYSNREGISPGHPKLGARVGLDGGLRSEFGVVVVECEVSPLQLVLLFAKVVEALEVEPSWRKWATGSGL